jgi:type II secretory pathway component HofQ
MSATRLRSPKHAFERQQPAVPGSLELQEALRQENEQLRTALATRIVIEQAKGMLAERFEMDVDEAFERLRHQARSHRMKLHVLAAAVTAREAWAEAIFPPVEPRNVPARRSCTGSVADARATPTGASPLSRGTASDAEH